MSTRIFCIPPVNRACFDAIAKAHGETELEISELPEPFTDPRIFADSLQGSPGQTVFIYFHNATSACLWRFEMPKTDMHLRFFSQAPTPGAPLEIYEATSNGVVPLEPETGRHQSITPSY